MSRVAFALLGSAVILVGAASASPAPAGPGVIVFAADRAPLYYGEIYRVDLDGKRVDLSRNVAHDVAPAISPDGKAVAFVSNRGGRVALYTVRIDGTHLARVSPYFFTRGDGQGAEGLVAWSPDGTRLAASIGGYGGASLLWFGDALGRGHAVHNGGAAAIRWSPDGSEVAYQSNDSEIDVVTPAGKRLWTVPGDYGRPFAWSKRNRLAVEYDKTIAVYDERGRKLTSFRGSDAAWSPAGSRLATVLGRRLQVRPGGVGAPAVDAQLPPTTEGAAYGPIDWLGDARLRVANGDGFVGFDVADDRQLQLPPSFATFDYPDAVSADGNEVAAVTVRKDLTATLAVDGYGGAVGAPLAMGPPCSEQPWFQVVQFTPDARSLVYQTGCAEPNADLYSIGGNGKGLRQLTSTSAHEFEPTWSPDGTKIAYVQQIVANKCDGCPSTIWVMNADGTGQHAITVGGDGWFDDHPAWSPDGRAIAYQHATYDTGPSVWTIPAAGGAAAQLLSHGDDPAFGPTRLAYIRGDVAPTLVQTSRFDGTDARTVARDSAAEIGSLAWSGSGTLAYLRSDEHGRLSLVIGPARYPLGSLDASPLGSGLAWSPDGTELAFDATDREGISDLWVVRADGTHLVRLTTGIGAVVGLSWRSG
jgi:Tol biopolymer transport system component